MGRAGNSLIEEGLLGPTVARSGHFLLESGHHGELWLDLELLCLHPRQLGGSMSALVEQLRPFEVDAVCGPLNEGAFLALLVAAELEVEFCYAERYERPESDQLFPVQYRLPAPLRPIVAGKRVAIVNDVISAGSAVRGAHADLLACGAEPVVIAALLVLGESAARFAQDRYIPLISLAHRPYHLWAPAECPLCAAGVPLQHPPSPR
jgi:orotate phosphoribosyltransferase